MRWALLLLFLSVLVGCRDVPLPAPGDVCRDIADCALTEGLACLSGECVRQACVRSRSCPVGSACVSELCSAPECAVDADCDGDARCFEGDCRSDLCDSVDECAPGLACYGEPPLCREPRDVCSVRQECALGQACKMPQGICAEACDARGLCVSDSWCDRGVCRAFCETSLQCDDGEQCANGRCSVPRDCSDEPPCEDGLRLRDPISCECVACLEDIDCAVGLNEACVQSECLRCEARETAPGVCMAAGLIERDGCCVECLGDGDCGIGRVCDRGACIDPSNQSCQTDTDCFQGLICDGDRCVRSSSSMPCSVQGDCPTGEACFADGRCRAEPGVCAGCPNPSRCVAEPGDDRGACVGCSEHCTRAGCPAEQRCFVPEDAAEGWCVDAEFWGAVCAP